MNQKDNLLKEDRRSNYFVKHEVEEFIYRLCNSDDPKLKEIGYQRKQELLDKHKSLSLLEDT
jgi:hypothetical protein